MLKKVLLFLLLIIALAYAGSFLVSNNLGYKGTVQIDASPEQVWKHVGSLKAMDAWSPWMAKDPNIDQEWTGDDGAVGSKNCWSSEVKDVGKGCQTITATTPNKRLDTKLEFKLPNEQNADAWVELNAKDGGTEVTWGFNSVIPRPFNYFTYNIDMSKNMEPDWSNGLNKLKEIVETELASTENSVTELVEE